MPAFVLLLVMICRRLYTLGRASRLEVRAVARSLFSVLVGVAFVSNFLQDNFIQPYTGLFLWFLMGVGEALYYDHRVPYRAAASPDGLVQGLARAG